MEGRFCAPIDILPGSPTCCLPCPATEWAYSSSFETWNTIAEWLNVVGLVLLVFMLASYIVLPAQKTRSHYLSVCLIVAVIFITLGFTIPLGASPEQCYNEITPNDMYSSTECAWSGAFIIAGGLSAATWVCIRALSMNLQICWDIVPGRKFFYFSQAFGWGIPAILFAATLTATGVSFRFGNACHVNHENSMADFWGPLMAIAGLAGVLQLITFAYCVNVYLRNLWSDSPANSTAASGSGLPSYTNSVRTQTARAVYQRLKKVLWLQWRGICIVSIILVDVIFFAIVFVYLDGLQNSVSHDITKVTPWLMCLAMHPTDRDACLALSRGWLVNEPTVVAVLILLSLAGVQVFIFLARPSVFPAWVDFFRHRFTSRQEFVSLDARQDGMRSASQQDYLNYDRGHQTTTFEMQKPGYTATITGPMSLDLDTKNAMFSPSSTIMSSPDDSYRSPIHTDRTTSPTYSMNRGRIPSEYAGQITPDLSHGRASPALSHGHTPPPSAFTTSTNAFARQPSTASTNPMLQRQNSTDYFPSAGPGRRPSQDRKYHPPGSSFSAPKTPSRQSSLRSQGYDPREIWAGRGGLALNPPREAGESVEDLGLGRVEERPR